MSKDTQNAINHLAKVAAHGMKEAGFILSVALSGLVLVYTMMWILSIICG